MIFNGNILTKFKLSQFKLWVEGFNKKYNMNILYTEPKHKLNLDNAWLSGFTVIFYIFSYANNYRVLFSQHIDCR